MSVAEHVVCCMFYMHLVNRKENGQLIPYLFSSNVKSVLLYGAEIWRKKRPCCQKSKDSSTTAYEQS